MFIRQVKSRRSICFQVGEKQNGRFVVRQHIGCSSNPGKLEALHLKAKQTLFELEYTNQLSLFKNSNSPTAKITNWKITGFHEVFGSVYDQIGFPQNLLRDLAIARIVYPKSKTATLRYLDSYLGISIGKNKLFSFLDTLDKDALSRIAFDFVASRHPTGISLCFYDITTLYFETGDEDALRQKGFSKDHRTDVPQILIGLFVDNCGYPFDFDFFEGKTFEGNTFIKAVEAIRNKYRFDNLTVVADAGMLSRKNLAYLDSVKVGYIVGARLKNLPQTVIRKVLSHSFSRQPVFQVVMGNQRLIVDYSAGRAKKNAQDRERTVAKLRQKIAFGKIVIRKSKYLLSPRSDHLLEINEGQISLDKQFDGLRGYLANQNNQLTVEDIISQYHELWRVEKAFRMSKHDLQERPVFHYLPQRIKAHLTLCFVSLLIMREAENRLSKIDCSLDRAIELLGKVGHGTVRIGTLEIAAENELDPATQLIHKLFEGH